jgi:hypothetical protein
MKPDRIGTSLWRALSLAALLALVLPGPADAQQQRPGRGAQKPAPQQQRPMMPPSERPRDANWRERQQQRQDHGRMNDEERRQLRRDISDHGRDIYGERQGQRRQ